MAMGATSSLVYWHVIIDCGIGHTSADIIMNQWHTFSAYIVILSVDLPVCLFCMHVLFILNLLTCRMAAL